MAEKWYDKSIKQTEIRLETDVSRGLNREQVMRRRRLYGENDVYPMPKKNFKTYMAHLLTDYTSLLLLVTLLIAAVFEETENLFVMLLILGTYYAIVLFTYVKAQKVLEGMGRSALPNAKVLREGRIRMVKQKQLVRGDVIYISAGDIVPCDARLIESSGLEVLEVNVTSVSHAVKKDAAFVDYHDLAPSQQKNMLFASTIVTKGTGRAICCSTGAETLVSVMGKNHPIVSHERLEVFDRINGFCKKWTLAMTLMILVLTVTDLLVAKNVGNGIFGSFMTGLSLAVASMSEFYTAFAYIVLACGIFGSVNRKQEINRGALIKNSAKLEDIKNLTCLIVPGDAGFHVHDMSLDKVYANGDTFATGEHGYRRNASRVLRYALISTGLYGVGKLTENNELRQNIYSSEEDAIIKAAESCSEYNIGLEQRYPMLEHRPKNADNRFDTTLVHYENSFVVALRGEYAAVLPNCRYYTENSRVYPMTPEKLNEFYIAAEKMARESYRVLAIASRDTIYKNLRRLSACQSDLTLEGLIAIREPTLPEAAKTILRCRNHGLKVIMLTSDIDESHTILAENLGLISGREQSVTGPDLAAMKEGLFRANLDVYALYQGLNLHQRRLLVRFLQEKGERVGYLCSELDEIILMREANVGFSQSVTLSDRAGNVGVDLVGRNRPIYTKDPKGVTAGCEALKFVSDVIVSEPDWDGTGGFNAMVDAILCSKSVYHNLYGMLKYMIASQIAKLGLVFLAILLGFTALTPPQILFCGLVIDFAAMIIIAFEKPDPSLLETDPKISKKLSHPLLRNMDSVLLGILWVALTLLSIFYMIKYRMIVASQIPTCCFIGLLLTQLAMLNECKREKSMFDRNVRVNGAHVTMLAVLIIFFCLIFLLPVIGDLFAIEAISLYAVGGTVLPTIVVTLFYEIQKRVNAMRKNENKGK